MNVPNVMQEPGIGSYLMFLHQNDSFVLLGKVYLKIGMHMNIYCIAASQLLQKIWCQAQCLLLHDSLHYSVVLGVLHVS